MLNASPINHLVFFLPIAYVFSIINVGGILCPRTNVCLPATFSNIARNTRKIIRCKIIVILGNTHSCCVGGKKGKMSLRAHNCQNDKVDFLHVPAIKINRVEVVCPSLSNYTFKITIFVSM